MPQVGLAGGMFRLFVGESSLSVFAFSLVLEMKAVVQSLTLLRTFVQGPRWKGHEYGCRAGRAM